MKVVVQSFSYRLGLPRDADLVFDVRFLDDPHDDTSLRPLTGLDSRVGAAIFSDANFDSFYSDLTSMLGTLLPCYERAGKRKLTIAIGCTGGRHRSVYVVESLGYWLAGESQIYNLHHRDLDNGTSRELI